VAGAGGLGRGRSCSWPGGCAASAGAAACRRPDSRRRFRAHRAFYVSDARWVSPLEGNADPQRPGTAPRALSTALASQSQELLIKNQASTPRSTASCCRPGGQGDLGQSLLFADVGFQSSEEVLGLSFGNFWVDADGEHILEALPKSRLARTASGQAQGRRGVQRGAFGFAHPQ